MAVKEMIERINKGEIRRRWWHLKLYRKLVWEGEKESDSAVRIGGKWRAPTGLIRRKRSVRTQDSAIARRIGSDSSGAWKSCELRWFSKLDQETFRCYSDGTTLLHFFYGLKIEVIMVIYKEEEMLYWVYFQVSALTKHS
ncbi:unnamed protein product [Microthlaspi erraticum]|uniref:Uncharacterized protein n=1 Tax=Microthlaspi erraticum TaxID=1685480 RepID=A0A6D2K8W0_9BRAS|nr:unnamed protein product [Microthlaspi erraticum]